MKRYELTIILGEKTTPAKKKSVVEKIQKQIDLFKGKVEKTDDWGKKDLAYIIAKNHSGNFLFFELELDPKAAKDLVPKLNLETDVLKYLLIRKE